MRNFILTLQAMLLLAFPSISSARLYNCSTGRFQTMDTFEGQQANPISQNKYLYCQANPINGSDPTGHDFESLDIASTLAGFDAFNFAFTAFSAVQNLAPVTLYVRAFAPWKTFGAGPVGRFNGDDRGFTTAHDPSGLPRSVPGATSRVASIIKLRPVPFSVISKVAYSDPSHNDWLGTATATPTVSANVTGNTLHMSMAGANPLIRTTADIDVKLDMSIQNTLTQRHYVGSLHGDAFPNAEVFVVGPRDNAKMLHTFTTSGGRDAGPYTFLPLDNNRPMGTFSVWDGN